MRLLPLLLPFLIAAAPLPNGDFESPAPTNPPPGWVMWGAQQYKNPAHFTRDTAAPHTGTACLRIHHPANTAGYIVSAPESALQVREGMQYTVTFFARAAKPGSAVFGFDAYRSLRPFAGAPGPGLYPVPVTPDWKQYTFTVREGWDFFADETKHLLLVFKATPDPREEQTLWIDDVTIAEQRGDPDHRLANPNTLQYAPLDHALAEGPELSILLDLGKPPRPAPRTVGGVSFHRLAGWTKLPYDKAGQYVLPKPVEDAIRDLRLPMTRFYAVGDESFSLESAIDRAADLCTRLDIPRSATVLEFETQGATSKLPPETWARGVRHSVAKGYAFDRWEIANEPYITRPTAAFPKPDDYFAHFAAVAAAIRKEQPAAKIGLPIHVHSPAWGNYLLKRAAGQYDFVVPHLYSFANPYRESFENIALTANWAALDDALRTNALIRRYNPDRPVTLYDTEWGLHGTGPKGEPPDAAARNGNIVGTMHRAVRLIHMLRAGPLAGASSWEMFTYARSPGFGFFAADSPHLRSMHYWLYYQFNRHAGHWVVPMSGTAPYYEGALNGRKYRGPLTPAVATLDRDAKTLYLIIANASWDKPAPARIQIRGLTPAKATATALTSDDKDGSPFVKTPDEITHPLPTDLGPDTLRLTLPPHSVTFVKIDGR